MGRIVRFFALCTLLLLLPVMTGCGDSGSAPSSGSGKGSWDNTPKVLAPSADGTTLSGNEFIEIDLSNTSKGYLMTRYHGDKDKVKFFIVTPDNVRYTYDLPASEDWMALPFTAGNGTYTLDVREHVGDEMYSNLYQESVEVSLEDEFSPFLYPNQYTWFTEDSQAVSKASSLTKDCGSGLDAVAEIYNYVIDTIEYDYDKASSVQSGYLPDVDQTLESKKGICFDYAALMTAMLRSQGIPTKLEIGYSGEVYHAWINTYLEETGWVDRIIEFDGKNWSLMDPTLAASNDSSSVKEYIGDGSNYIVKYSR